MKRRSKLITTLLISSMLTGITLTSCGNSYPFYEPIVNQYRVRWFSNEELTTLLYETTVWEGENATYPSDLGTPTYEGTDPKYEWAFTNWSHLTNNVTENMDVYAIFTPTLKTYTMTYLKEDDSVYKTLEVDAGTKVSEIDHPAGPAKDSDNQYSYTFKAWETTVSNDSEVLSDLTFTPVYERTNRVYKVYFMDGDGVTVLDEQEVEYGSYATIPEDVTPTSVSTVNTEDYDTEFTKQFLGWSPNPLTTQITQNTEFKPSFSENNVTVRSYQGKIVDAYTALTGSEQDYTYGTEQIKVKELDSATSVDEASVSKVHVNFGFTNGGANHQTRVFIYEGEAEVSLQSGASDATSSDAISGKISFVSAFNKNGVLDEGTDVIFEQTQSKNPITMTWDNLDLSVSSSNFELPSYTNDSVIKSNIDTYGATTDNYEVSLYHTARAIYANFIEDATNTFFSNVSLKTPY